MKDEEIDYSDIPELDEEFFVGAVIWKPGKRQITIRIGADVYDFFKGMGKFIRKPCVGSLVIRPFASNSCVAPRCK
jgi:hypothetical protein